MSDKLELCWSEKLILCDIVLLWLSVLARPRIAKQFMLMESNTVR